MPGDRKESGSPGGAATTKTAHHREDAKPLLGAPARSDADMWQLDAPPSSISPGRRKFFHNGPVRSPDGPKAPSSAPADRGTERGAGRSLCDKAAFARFTSWAQDVLSGEEGYGCISTRLIIALSCAGIGAVVCLIYDVGGVGEALSSKASLVLQELVVLLTNTASGLNAAWQTAWQSVGAVALNAGGRFSSLASEETWTAILAWFTDTESDACPDGLLIPGPAPSRSGTLVTLLLLLWAFVATAIGADIFMEAIEFITSQEVSTVVSLPGGKSKTLTHKVWNATVANLSLMALGTSSPEILLSIIEIVGSGFYAGELGPSCIVGSAAFNLMMISALCVVALPAGEGRYIRQTSVFYITSAASCFAYFWLYLILVQLTPDIVTPIEGLLTLFFFPMLVLVAYQADVGTLGTLPGWIQRPLDVVWAVNDEPYVFVEGVGIKERRVLGIEGNVDSDAYIKRSQAYYRRTTLGAHDARQKRRERQPLWTAMANMKTRSLLAVGSSEFEIGASQYSVEATDRRVLIDIFRTGATTEAASVHYEVTLGRIAGESGASQIACEGFVLFEPTQQRSTLVIEVLPEDIELARKSRESFGAKELEALPGGATGHQHSTAAQRAREEANAAERARYKLAKIASPTKVQPADTIFLVRIDQPSAGATVGPVSETAVVVEDESSPGVFSLESDRVVVKEDAGKATLTVRRDHGAKGVVSVRVKTKNGSAVAPADYLPVDTVLTFRDGQKTASIDVLLVKDKSYEGTESFQVIFSDATGGATFHPDTNGYPQRALATVVIMCDDHVDCGSSLLVRFCGFNSDVCALVMEAWYAQFEDALTYDRDGSLLGHLVALPWKLFFALAPPTAMAGGWACFVVALSMIGILTALIGDLASHLGCCLGISKAITAITFVAVGTSLPDTFASMKAAREEEYADASLGNVTGSNSVNVFLGLGLPWAMAAVYWSAPSFFPYIWGGHPEESTWRVRYASESWYNDGMPLSFAVPAGDLGYTVFMFLLCAMVTLGIIFLRRAVFGVELGGPQPWASLTFVVFAGLWVFYLSACIVNGT